MSDHKAKANEIWVCGACGKTSRTRYGFNAGNGWDESCMMHAVLCQKEKVDGKWLPLEKQPA